MLASKRFSQFDSSWLPLRYIVPTFAGFTLLCTSFLTWLRDPLMGLSSAWNIPVYIGWPFRSPFLNYGVLCLLCAIYMFFVASTPETGTEETGGSSQQLVVQYARNRYSFAGWVCLLPVILFCLQYLVFDLQSINQLAQHKMQALLVSQHLEYRLAPQRIPLLPFAIDISLPQTRLSLLVDQISLGSLVPIFGSVALFIYQRRLNSMRRRNASVALSKQRGRIYWVPVSLVILLGAFFLGRVPLSLICQYESNLAMASGNYNSASQWSDDALALDPGLNQVAYYHVQHGQIRFFIEHNDQSDDSLAYLSFSAYQQGDYTTAYQQLFGTWERNRSSTWVIDQMSLILMRQVEANRPLSQLNPGDDSDPLLISARENDKSLPVLRSLIQINPTNVYARYVSGRINYDLHAYIDCTTEMQFVNQLSRNHDIQSAAFTTIGLSEEGQGELESSRFFLQEAVALDPNYYNNVAREQLSGLH
ncbi:MAG: hypothetical protein NVS2B12_06890 [Ktedonobacteraceae bacterium]